MARPSPIRVAIAGAGNRGTAYAGWCAEHPDEARVVAVADPDSGRRSRLADAHAIPAAGRHDDALALLAEDVDVLVVATPDRAHVALTVAALDAGLDVLLEKPVAPHPDGVEAIRAAAALSRGTVTVAHVLRYTPFFDRLHGLVGAGAIGQLVGIEHTEQIGFWHFAHSYVRGNWRRADEASPMLLAKACHDLDILRWLAGAPAASVASRGGLHHFRLEHVPQGAPDHCLEGCPVEATCPFHAGRFYVEGLAGWDGPPVSVVTADTSRDGRLAALADGPYGRCVYRCDNDVADHQVVQVGFANGVTATLTVSAFTRDSTRTIAVRGSHGELCGDLESGVLRLRRFTAEADRHEEVHDVDVPRPVGAPAGAFTGHAGGDAGLMADLVRRARARRAGGALPEAATSLAISLDSHEMAFAAETARSEQRVVHLRGAP